MPDIQKSLYDASIRRTVYLERFSTSVRNDIVKLLNQAQQSIVEEVIKIDPTAPSITKYRELRLANLYSRVDEILGESFRTIRKEVDSQLKKLVVLEASTSAQMVNQIMGIDLFNVTLTNEYLQSIVNNTLIEGQTVKKWFNTQAKNLSQRISRALAKEVHNSNILQIGMVKGESIGKLVTLIKGTKTEVDGVGFHLARKDATTLARTSVLQVANQARLSMYQANSDLIEGYQVVATLDNRTCAFCGSVDGQTYDLSWNPTSKGPAVGGPPTYHFNCRCTFIPVLKSYEKMMEEKPIEDISKTEAINTLNSLPTTTFSGTPDPEGLYVKNPFRVVSDDLRRKAEDILENASHDDFTTTWVPLDELRTTQASVIRETVDHFIRQTGEIKELVDSLQVVYENGKLIIMDGNNRLAAEKLLGKAYVRVNGLNFPVDKIIKTEPLPLINKKLLRKLDELPEATRASMGGPVSGVLKYDEWLRLQPVDVQKDILGPSKWKLWNDNKLSMSDLLDQSGRPLSLDKLKEVLDSKVVISPRPPFDIDPLIAERVKVAHESSSSVKAHIEDLNRFSSDIMEFFREKEINWRISDKTVTWWQEMIQFRGVTPRGWPAGYTWDDVSACYNSSTKTIYAGSGLGSSASIIGHETGHAIFHEILLEVQKQDYMKLQAKYFDFLLKYFQQEGRGGRVGTNELFAEMTANMIKYGKVRSDGILTGTNLQFEEEATKMMTSLRLVKK